MVEMEEMAAIRGVRARVKAAMSRRCACSSSAQSIIYFICTRLRACACAGVRFAGRRRLAGVKPQRRLFSS